MQIKISKFTKLGALIVFSLVVLIWGLNYLKGIDFFSKTTQYHVVYDRVDGLVESSSVTISGYKVGQVTDICFTPDNTGKLLITFSLEGDFKISKGSVARIISSDIMGTKAIRLEIIPSNEYYQAGDTLPGSIESDLKEQVSMQVLPLKKKAEQLIASIDSAMMVVTYVFNAKTRQNLSESFEHINQTVVNIEETSNELKELIRSNGTKFSSIITNFDSISSDFKRNTAKMDLIIANVEAISDTLSKVSINPIINQITLAVNGLNSILKNLQNTNNTAGLLLNDSTLYHNLEHLTTSLDLLLKDFRNNPKRYVHFSALDLGKEVYITSRPNAPNIDDQIIYKVHLLSSPSQVPVNNRLFKDLGEIEEVFISEIYNYMVGNTTSFDEISILHAKAKVNFPDASIVAFKNGRKIKLEKAIKNQK